MGAGLGKGASEARGLGQAILALLGLAVTAVVIWAVFLATPPEKPGLAAATAAPGDPGEDTLTGSKLGPSGLPVPRFVSLKTDVTNVRRGPGREHAVAYVYRRKGLPVEIIAEFEHWRRIRGSEGDEGWVYQSLLAGKRTALVLPWKKDTVLELHAEARPDAPVVAKLSSGVIADVENCSGAWCEISAGGYDGYADQQRLFGVYPGERVGD